MVFSGFKAVSLTSFVLRCKLGKSRRFTQNKGTNYGCTLGWSFLWFKGVTDEWVPFVGLITIDGLSNVGPKRVLNQQIKEVASFSLRLACKGIRGCCIRFVRWLLLFKDVSPKVL